MSRESSSTFEGAPPRVTIVTNGNYFAYVGLGPLLRAFATQWDFQIFVTTGLRKPNASPLQEAFRLFRRWGPAYSAYKLSTLALPEIASRVSRRPLTIRDLARRLSLDVTATRNVNESSIAQRIRAFAPDLMLSFSCPYKISPELLEIPSIGCLNVHSSLLPAYAGVCTYVHVLADGQNETGVTLHEMVERFDAGRIVSQRSVGIRPCTSIFSLFKEQCTLASEMLLQELPDIISRRAISGQQQDFGERSYCREPRASDIQRLRANGHTLFTIDDLRTLVSSNTASGTSEPRTC